jgi:hypothetical protein
MARARVTGEPGGHGAAGVRGSLDLLGRGAWTLGVAAAASAPHHGHGDGAGGASATAYLAWTTSIARFDVRAQIGLGFGGGGDGGGSAPDRRGRDPRDPIAARTTGGDAPPPIPPGRGDRHGGGDGGASPRAEAALLVGLPLGERFGLVAGPVVSTSDRGEPAMPRGRGGASVETTVMAGLRYGF